jgi:pimeloyl-ACP methyl ester carboxylesterase
MADGIPPNDRIEATRLVMENRRDELRRTGEHPEELARLVVWLRDGDRKFLLYDPTGDGRVAEVFGDLTTADDVAVVVPGITNDISNFDDRVRRDAEALWGGDSERAVVAWLGYDTPGIDAHAVSTARATNGGAALASFTDGLRSTVGGSITVAAHSYGTVVATCAAQAGMEVDRVVLLGSPGVPADDASVFNGADVYVMTNGLDPVPKLDDTVTDAVENAVLGPVIGRLVDPQYPGADMVNNVDPNSSSFGATILEGNYRGGHSDYYRGDELDRIRDVVSPGPIDTGSTIIHRYVDENGNRVVSEVPTF